MNKAILVLIFGLTGLSSSTFAIANDWDNGKKSVLLYEQKALSGDKDAIHRLAEVAVFGIDYMSSTENAINAASDNAAKITRFCNNARNADGGVLQNAYNMVGVQDICGFSFSNEWESVDFLIPRCTLRQSEGITIGTRNAKNFHLEQPVLSRSLGTAEKVKRIAQNTRISRNDCAAKQGASHGSKTLKS